MTSIRQDSASKCLSTIVTLLSVRDALFLPRHLTPRPVVVIRLQLTRIDALDRPLCAEDNLPLLARILAV